MNQYAKFCADPWFGYKSGFWGRSGSRSGYWPRYWSRSGADFLAWSNIRA